MWEWTQELQGAKLTALITSNLNASFAVRLRFGFVGAPHIFVTPATEMPEVLKQSPVKVKASATWI